MKEDQTAELRHILSFVQSHLDKHDVRMSNCSYDIVSHTDTEPGRVPEPDFEVTGQEVEVSFKYTVPFEE